MSTQTIATQTSEHNPNYALWTAALATAGAGALAFKYIKRVQSRAQYDPELTDQLNTIFNTLQAITDYQQHRNQMFDLVKNGANPNIKNSPNTSSLLDRAVAQDDFEFTQLCLQKGANSDIPTLDLRTPLTWVRSDQVAQCLLDNKADPYQRDRSGDTLLHHIVTRCSVKPSQSIDDVLTLFCNAGLDPNQLNNHGASPLHHLFTIPHLEKKPIRTMIPLLWIGANLDQTSDKGIQTPRQILHEKSPELSDKAQALSVAISQKQEELYSAIRTTHNDLLRAHMNQDSAGLVIEYVGREKLPWKKAYWSELKELSAPRAS